MKLYLSFYPNWKWWSVNICGLNLWLNFLCISVFLGEVKTLMGEYKNVEIIKPFYHRFQFEVCPKYLSIFDRYKKHRILGIGR